MARIKNGFFYVDFKPIKTLKELQSHTNLMFVLGILTGLGYGWVFGVCF